MKCTNLNFVVNSFPWRGEVIGSIFTAPRECLCEVGHLIEGGLLIIEEILQCIHVNVKCKVWYLLSKTFCNIDYIFACGGVQKEWCRALVQLYFFG